MTEGNLVETKRTPLAQLVLCNGCCCGRTDRGFPPVPVERFKEIWKAEKLNRSVQLTISGCLGPCDVANVAVVNDADGAQWLGELGKPQDYEHLLEWARTTHRAGQLQKLPTALARQRFVPFRREG